jgi:hypothetical protein
MRALAPGVAMIVWLPTVAVWIVFALLFRLLNTLNRAATGEDLLWHCAGIVAGPERLIID